MINLILASNNMELIDIFKDSTNNYTEYAKLLLSS